MLSSAKAFLQNRPYAYLTLYLPIFILQFFLTELLVPSDTDYWVSYLPFDDLIPFCEVFVIPYCLWYPLMIGTGFMLLACDGEVFKRYMYFVMTGFTICLVFCLVFPNGQDLRPASPERDNLLTKLVFLIYAADTNTNVFPSMHVVGCIAAAGAVLRSRKLKKLRTLWLVVSLLICASTVFIKQHSVLDIIGAVVLCMPLSLFYLCRFRKRENNAP